METIDLISAIVSLMVVGGLIMWGGLFANATLIAEVLWRRRAAAAAEVVENARGAAAYPAMTRPAR